MSPTERTYGSFSPRPRSEHGDLSTSSDSPSPSESGRTRTPSDHEYPDARGASFMSRVFFAWFDPLVEIASRRRIEAHDIWNLPVDMRCERAYEEYLAAYKVTGSLLGALARCYWPQFLRSAILSWCSVAFSIAHPLLLYTVIKIAMNAKHRQGVEVIMLLLASILVAKIASAAFKRHSLRVLLVASTKAVGAIATLVFDRAISLPTALEGDNTASISSADASFLLHELGKIYHVLTLIQMPWVYTVHITANLYILYSIIGDGFVVSILSAMVAQLIALLLMSLDTNSSHRWTDARAKRIQVVSECVRTIQTIKLHAWENRFLRRIQNLRDDEVSATTQHLAVAVVTRSILAVLPETIMIFTFAGLTFSSQGLTEFDPPSVFATIAIVYRLHWTFTMFISQVNDLSRAYVFLKHVEVLLKRHHERHERCTKRVERSSTPSSTPLVNHPQVMIHVSHAMIARTSDEPILVNTNLLVRKGELVDIYGKTGSGKSTFLRALVGDAIQLNRRGVVEVKGKVAYCSQNPWLQTLSIRDNILFGESYEEQKYLNVLHSCCLLRDLRAFPAGDKTVVGPKGLNISGGQKARICLARACYADADVYLLDTPLASVDSIVQSDIFSRCFINLLKHKTVVLVTHNMEVVTSPFVDQVVRLEDHQFVHETELGRSFTTNPQLSYKPRRSAELPKRFRSHGSIQVPKTLPTEVSPESHHGLELVDYTASRIDAVWKAVALKVDCYRARNEMEQLLRPQVVNEYIALCGSRWFIVPLCLTVVLARMSLVGSDIWVCLWAEQVATLENDSIVNPVEEEDNERQINVAVYAMLIVSAAAMTFYGSVIATVSCKEAANALFERMINGVLHAPMSFFYVRPIGEIVNRFSGDVVRVDSYLQDIVFKNASSLAGIVVPLLVLMILIPDMILILPVIVYLIRRNRYHLRVALEMSRHCAASLSPCYNSIEEFVEGRRVIQAFGFGQVDRFRRLHQQQLDHMLKMQYANSMFQAWSALKFMKLDILLIGVLIVCPFRRDMNPVVLGLALNYVFLMNSQLFNWYSSALELGSSFLVVDRIVEYANSTPENGVVRRRSGYPEDGWPTQGEITFERASFQYNSLSGPVLKDITLHILPGEKVGLVGRTGAGKSSMTMALFRIHELVSGRILIDGVDISLIDVYTLRSRLSIIPQSPLFFQGSLRSYLDPFDEFEDALLWAALRKTGLAGTVSRMDKKLIAELHENAENLSQGERQLLCLSRVLLKQSRIVVLDEATAAIDHVSEEILQAVLQREFKDTTVISIAHRLESILQFHRVVVMDEGHIVQCGSVEELVAEANGPFFDLLEGALLKM